MTISTQARTAGPFACNGATTVFPFNYKVFAASDVVVVLRIDSTGTEVTLVLGVDYTVTLNANQNTSPGGTVTTLTAFPTGQTITLTSAVPYLQPTDLTNQGGFYPSVINAALDRLTIFAQQVLGVANRALKFPLSDGNLNGTLPGKDQRKGTVLAFDTTTGLPVAGPNIASLGTVSEGIEAINTVATNIDDVNSVADNIDEVIDFNARYLGPKTNDPTTRNDGSALQEGDLYFNNNTDRLRAYTGVRWSEANSGSVTVQQFVGDGTTTSFQMNIAPDNENLVQVFIGGVYQSKTEYDLTGTNADILTFTVAPPTGLTIEAVTFSVLPLGVVDDTQVQMTGGGTLNQLGDTDSSLLVGGISASVLAKTANAFATFAALKAGVVSSMTVARTKQHTSGGVGAVTYVQDGTTGTAGSGDEAKFFDATGKGWRLSDENGFVSVHQLGGSTAVGADLTAAINKAVSGGYKHITIKQTYFVLSGNINLNGATLYGNRTTFGGGYITGGQLNDVSRTSQKSPVRGGQNYQIVATRAKTKLMFKQATMPNGSTTPNNEIYSIISPSSYGGIARFVLTNGVGGSSSADAGAPFDRLRPVQSFIYDGGVALKMDTSAQSAGVTTFATDLIGKVLPRVTGTKFSNRASTVLQGKTVPAGDYVEFSVPCDVMPFGNVAVYAQAGASSSVTITVNGVAKAPVSAVSASGQSEVRLFPLDFDIGLIDTNFTVRVANTGASNVVVIGMNLYNIDKLRDGDSIRPGYVDSVYLSNEKAMLLVNGLGASIDSVIKQGTVFYGSYHGGDTGSQCRTVMSTNQHLKNVDHKTTTNPTPSNTIAVGEVYLCNCINSRYTGTLNTSPTVSVWINFDFSVDGGCDVRGTYYAPSDFTVQTIFGGMHGTDPALNRIVNFDFPGTGTTYEYPLNRVPFLQFSNDNRHMAVIPQTFELDNARSGITVADLSGGNYKKFYYCIAEEQDTLIRVSQPLTFGCLYLYGKSIV